MKNEHLLIIRFSTLSDTAMLVPVVASLARSYPDLRVTVLSSAISRPLFDGLAPNVGFMYVENSGEYNSLPGLNALYHRLKAKHFTAVADMQNSVRSRYLRTRFKVDRTLVAHLDLHRAGKRRLVAKTHKRLVQQPTIFHNYAEVLSRLRYPIKWDFDSIFQGTKGNLRLLPEAWMREKKPFQKWIGIAPSAFFPCLTYPIEKMEEVVDCLSQKHSNAKIFLMGTGVRERQVFRRLSAHIPRCVIMAEHVKDLAEELILISHMDAVVSMDSTYTHLASSVGTPVVSIWGATHPYLGYMGWQQREENAVQLSLPCRPCSIRGNKACFRHDRICLQGITPDMIVEKVEKVIENQNIN